MPAFDAQAFLQTAGAARRIVEYHRGEAIFSQGDACEHVMYIQRGGVKLSVRSRTGREAIVAVLGPADFFGEGCLAGQPVRRGSAMAITASTILLVDKHRMVRVLHKQRAMSDRFITHMLARNASIEQDLIGQAVNSVDKRLARALLLLARYGQIGTPKRVIPKISRDRLARMIGSTRSTVTFALNKFKTLGFIEEHGAFTINRSLLSVVLRE